MPAFAAAGYYVVAPDCRGFGRTAGWDNSLDADATPFLMLNMVRDQIALVYAIGYRKTEMVVGHDQGEHIAVYARHHPARHVSASHDDLVGRRRTAIIPVRRRRNEDRAYTNAELDAEYARLNPPRRGYQDYWASKQADEDMKHVPQGMSDFFRAFYYMKGGEFPGQPEFDAVETHADRQRGRRQRMRGCRSIT